ncbi:hypothetical protein FV217_09200 [Methylobacterium sp. WL9]|nr:hypothetical protein FV217_09200 [Methylobacterium sp. WL9]
MAYETSAPPAACASCASKPAGRSGAVTGAKQTKRPRPVAKLARAEESCAQRLTGISLRAPRTSTISQTTGVTDVVDDLPRPVPVGRAELEVLETYLGSALDDLLRAMTL